MNAGDVESAVKPPAGCPRGPRLPGVAQLLLLYLRPVPFLNRCAARFGPTFTLRIPGMPPVVQTSEPDAIEAIFRGSPEIFQGGKANLGLKPVVGSNSLLLLDGPRHRGERKLIAPMFSGARMHTYGTTIRAVVNRSIDRWPIGRAFRAHDEARDTTLEVILQVMFGVDDEAVLRQFRHAVHRVLKLAVLLFPDSHGNVAAEGLARAIGRVVPRWNAFAALASLDELIYSEVNRRRQADLSRRHDVLSLLMQARYDDGSSMSREEIRDELMTLLMTGHETSATILAWCICHLCQHRDNLDTLREEIHAAGRGGAVPLEAIDDLGYLDAVIKETMRMTPVFSLVARVLTQPHVVGTIACPADVVVSPNIYGTHHRADLWEDPERFRPERFLGREESPFHYFPFGGGVRKCIGLGFACYEMKIFLTEMVRRTRFATVPGYRARIVRSNNTLAPSKGVPIVVTSRS
ncbi:MAG: cytochrome P450 [Vicinamibacterales bacterium]